MEFRRIKPSDLPAVFELLSASGWAHRMPDLDHFTALVNASQIAEVAVIDEKVVGFARGITDGLSNGYLSMVVVAEAQRGQGIGRRLVEHVTSGKPGVTWALRAGRKGAAEFFARLGFETSTIAMEKRRPT